MFFAVFILAQLFLFFLDVCMTACFSFPSFNFTVAGLLVGCYATLSYAECAFLLTPALLHGSLTSGVTGHMLILFIGLIGASKWALLHVHHQYTLLYSLMGAYTSYTLITAYPFLKITSLMAYTIIAVGGTLSMINFSLKWLIAVKRGNRL